jgi:hypothetical protein
MMESSCYLVTQNNLLRDPGTEKQINLYVNLQHIVK